MRFLAFAHKLFHTCKYCNELFSFLGLSDYLNFRLMAKFYIHTYMRNGDDGIFILGPTWRSCFISLRLSLFHIFRNSFILLKLKLGLRDFSHSSR